MNTVKS